MTLWLSGMRVTAGRLQAATPWVALSSLGTYQNGASDGSVQPMARDLLIRDERVREFKGIVNFSGVTTSSYTFFTFGSAYFPDYERDWAGAGIGGSSPFRVFLSTAGNWGLTGQTAGITSMRLDDFQIKSATGAIPG
ncbi:hypothetical protein ABT298_21530 [Streptomyces sp. NPDC001034]|uniref:hypothetical protein n=1 Tax=Streptomyces sp. NPDC001034 TaxID=3154375 RepID=UPI00332C3858